MLDTLAMARPKNQGARRTQLLEAAGRAVVERGVSDVGVRDVAAAAGMAPGSITYYYPSLPGLLLEVYGEAVERFCTDRWALVDAVTDPRERLILVIRSGVPQRPDDPLVRLLYEFSAHAIRNPSDRAIWTSLFDRQVALYQTILETGESLGVFRLTCSARSAARNLVALEDAYGFHIIAGGTVDYEGAVALILAYATTVTACDLGEA